MSTKKEDNTQASIIIRLPGKLPPLPEETFEEIKSLSPFLVYVMNALVDGKVMTGFSTDEEVARSYVFRSVEEYLNTERKTGKNETRVERKLKDGLEVFWYRFYSQHYFALLQSIPISLLTTDTYQISFWRNFTKAEIQIAPTLDVAREKIYSHLHKRTFLEVANPEQDQTDFYERDKVIAAVKRTSTQLFKDLARQVKRSE